MEEFFGVVPCTLMSMMSNDLIPSACEVDTMGALAMYVLAQASRLPSALVDWNNNYGEDPDKGVIFHCSNLPKDIFKQDAATCHPNVLSRDHRRHGGRRKHLRHDLRPRQGQCLSPICALSTDDVTGTLRAYVGEGEFTDDPLMTFGGYGVVKVPDFQGLLQYICEKATSTT